jgi:hypothetical protein
MTSRVFSVRRLEASRCLWNTCAARLTTDCGSQAIWEICPCYVLPQLLFTLHVNALGSPLYQSFCGTMTAAQLKSMTCVYSETDKASCGWGCPLAARTNAVGAIATLYRELFNELEREIVDTSTRSGPFSYL